MSPAEYKRERQRRGTQATVAAALDVQRETITRRETGDAPIHREAWLALLSLPLTKKRARGTPNTSMTERRATDSAQPNGA